MPQTTYEQPVEIDHQVARLQIMARQAFRDDFLDEVLTGGGDLYEHPYRASCDIRLQSTHQCNAQSWRMREDIGALQLAYFDALIRLEMEARVADKSRDLNPLNTSLTVVIEVANKLGFLGYRINWEQNVRWALRASRYGLSGYAIVDGYVPALERINLKERLGVLGTDLLEAAASKRKVDRPHRGRLSEVSRGNVRSIQIGTR